MEKSVKYLDEVTIRFAGDSGDGMQLTGSQFSNTSGTLGNDVNTFPDYPSEIRAPEGTLYGVSAYQIQFGQKRVNTPGDEIDVLVAMNASSLKVNLPNVKKNGILIVNSDGFDEKNLKLAKFETNPLKDDSLNEYQVYSVDMTSYMKKVLEDTKLSVKEVERTKNFFALGLTYWLFNRPLDKTVKWLNDKFAKKPYIRDANIRAIQAGWEYGASRQEMAVQYHVEIGRAHV